MIKNLIFLSLILIISLFAYNFFYNVVNYKIMQFEKSVADIPVVVVSHNDSLITRLSVKLDSLDFVDNIKISMADTLRKNLIKRYKLEKAKKYLEDSKLPNVLKIFVKKGMFTSYNKTVLAQKLKPYTKEIIIKYNDEIWQETTDKIDFFKRILYNISLIYAGLLGILFIYLRYIFEMMTNPYWIKFAKSGGRYSKRFYSFLLNSFVISLFSVLIAYFAFYPLKVFSPYFNPVNRMIVIYEFAIVLCVNLLTMFLIKRKYD